MAQSAFYASFYIQIKHGHHWQRLLSPLSRLPLSRNYQHRFHYPAPSQTIDSECQMKFGEMLGVAWDTEKTTKLPRRQTVVGRLLRRWDVRCRWCAISASNRLWSFFAPALGTRLSRRLLQGSAWRPRLVGGGVCVNSAHEAISLVMVLQTEGGRRLRAVFPIWTFMSKRDCYNYRCCCCCCWWSILVLYVRSASTSQSNQEKKISDSK